MEKPFWRVFCRNKFYYIMFPLSLSLALSSTSEFINKSSFFAFTFGFTLGVSLRKEIQKDSKMWMDLWRFQWPIKTKCRRSDEKHKHIFSKTGKKRSALKKKKNKQELRFTLGNVRGMLSWLWIQKTAPPPKELLKCLTEERWIKVKNESTVKENIFYIIQKHTKNKKQKIKNVKKTKRVRFPMEIKPYLAIYTKTTCSCL